MTENSVLMAVPDTVNGCSAEMGWIVMKKSSSCNWKTNCGFAFLFVIVGLAFFVPIAIATLVILTFVYSPEITYDVPTPISPPHLVNKNSLPISEQWRKQFFIPRRNYTPQIVAVKDRLIISSNDETLLKSNLTVLDSSTGNLLWSIGDLPVTYEIAADSEKIYLAVQYQWRAYDIMTGSEVWRSNEMPTTKITRTELVDQNLKVFTDEDSFNKSEYVTYVVDTTTGSIKEETRKNLDNNVRWLCEDSNAVYWADPVHIWAVDKLTDQNLWEADIKTATHCTNISSNQMVIQSDFGFSEIYGIDRATGKITWSYPKTIISNITNVEDTIYAIIENGNLVGIDSVTGQEIGATEFSHPRELQGSISEAYFVVATNRKLFVYLGNSQEIIAFDLMRAK